MNENQFRWTLQNRWTWRPRALFGGGADRAVLRDAAQASRLRTRIDRALDVLLSEEQRQAVTVDRIGDDAVSLRVSDTVIGETLRGQQARLQHDLARRVSGLRRLTLRITGTAEKAE